MGFIGKYVRKKRRTKKERESTNIFDRAAMAGDTVLHRTATTTLKQASRDVLAHTIDPVLTRISNFIIPPPKQQYHEYVIRRMCNPNMYKYQTLEDIKQEELNRRAEERKQKRTRTIRTVKTIAKWGLPIAATVAAGYYGIKNKKKIGNYIHKKLGVVPKEMVDRHINDMSKEYKVSVGEGQSPVMGTHPTATFDRDLQYPIEAASSLVSRRTATQEEAAQPTTSWEGGVITPQRMPRARTRNEAALSVAAEKESGGLFARLHANLLEQKEQNKGAGSYKKGKTEAPTQKIHGQQGTLKPPADSADLVSMIARGKDTKNRQEVEAYGGYMNYDNVQAKKRELGEGVLIRYRFASQDIAAQYSPEQIKRQKRNKLIRNIAIGAGGLAVLGAGAYALKNRGKISDYWNKDLGGKETSTTEKLKRVSAKMHGKILKKLNLVSYDKLKDANIDIRSPHKAGTGPVNAGGLELLKRIETETGRPRSVGHEGGYTKEKGALQLDPNSNSATRKGESRKQEPKAEEAPVQKGTVSNYQKVTQALKQQKEAAELKKIEDFDNRQAGMNETKSRKTDMPQTYPHSKGDRSPDTEEGHARELKKAHSSGWEGAKDFRTIPDIELSPEKAPIHPDELARLQHKQEKAAARKPEDEHARTSPVIRVQTIGRQNEDFGDEEQHSVAGKFNTHKTALANIAKDSEHPQVTKARFQHQEASARRTRRAVMGNIKKIHQEGGYTSKQHREAVDKAEAWLTARDVKQQGHIYNQSAAGKVRGLEQASKDIEATGKEQERKSRHTDASSYAGTLGRGNIGEAKVIPTPSRPAVQETVAEKIFKNVGAVPAGINKPQYLKPEEQISGGKLTRKGSVVEEVKPGRQRWVQASEGYNNILNLGDWWVQACGF